jgi:hypothetical protein
MSVGSLLTGLAAHACSGAEALLPPMTQEKLDSIPWR